MRRVGAPQTPKDVGQGGCVVGESGVMWGTVGETSP